MSDGISDGLLHLFTQGIELENITVHQNIAMAKELLKLRTALKKAMEILLTDDEQVKAELFLELKGCIYDDLEDTKTTNKTKKSK